MSDILHDLMKCILLLSGLADFSHTQSIISHDIFLSTKSDPITSITIRKYLDSKQALQESDAKCPSALDPVALSAQTKHTPSVVCMNCKHAGHMVSYCVSAGRCMAGKSIMESKEAQC